MSQNEAPYPSGMSAEAMEKHRRECEARYWLKVTGGGGQKVDDVIKRIAEKRGTKAAEQLREDMREQYRLQQQTKTTTQGDL